MGALQPWHLILILIIVLIIFGAGRLTEVGGALGKGVRDFRENVRDPAGLGPLGRGQGGSSPSTTSPGPTTSSGAQHCTSCGAELPSGARYCAKCGTGVAAS